ncbi:MAG: hypothetical protein LBK94_00030 [Prevotellaceae bacterium]|jgi:hypothetical protein|nr:hypothetical protein [Prevotellaceae bacterium]
MYEIKVTARTKDPNRPNVRYYDLIYKGVFAEQPKSRITVQEMREQVRETFLKQLQEQNAGLNFTIGVQVGSKPLDFFIKEDANRNQE